MAKLAEFYGIIIRMRSELGEPHHWPHFHAGYADYEAVYAVIDGEVEKIAGSLPRESTSTSDEMVEDERCRYYECLEQVTTR